MKNYRVVLLFVISISLLLYGCGKPPSPIDMIRTALRGVSTFSIILDDMKEDGNFFKTYYHKYQVVSDDTKTTTDWQEVSKDYFQQYLPFLGMTIWTKQDGKEGTSIGPPGYEYVGNSRYGRWETHSSGRSFWVFYGQYRLLSDLLGPGPIYARGYNRYQGYRSQGRPYYGPNKEYGTNGSLTRQQKPNFYSRRMSTSLTQKASFSNRVNNRIGRTRANVRGRSARVGK